MSNHISDEIPRLLTGDAPRDVVMTAAAHLRSCADCQQDLVSAVVAHASLASAHRFAPEVVAADLPPAVPDDDELQPDLPDLSSMFDQVRAEAAEKTSRPPRRRLMLVAAAAVVLIGGGGATYALTSGSGTPSTHSVSLAAFQWGRTIDGGKKTARVTIIGDSRVKLDASTLPKLDSTHQYEVWLTDARRSRMQSIGFIGDNNTADLKVPSKYLSQYDDIEVSVQKVNQDKYSGVSVLRGKYS